MAVPANLKLPAPEPQGRNKPLPRLAIAATCFVQLAHFYAICSLFSYAGIMCADMGWAVDRDHAGEIAGFLQSSNVLGRLPTSFVWGYFASRFGFRTGLQLSMLSLLIGGLWFGFCKTAVVAVAVRFTFFGMGNGWVTFYGPMAFELGGEERQTEVMGMLLAAGTFAQLLGPSVGGWTYGAVEDVPGLFPSLVGAGLAAAAMVAIWAWMPPLPAAAKSGDASRDARGDELVEVSAAPGFREVIATWPVPLLVFLRSTHGFLHFSFFEVVPLWAISSYFSGGLALTESTLGSIFAASGLISAVFLIFGLQRLTKHLGLRRAAVLGNVVCLVCLAATPFSPNAISLAVIHVTTACGMQLLGAAYVATINNAVAPSQRATVNGVCVTFEALGKGLGPMSGAIVFAWSLSHWGKAGHAAVFFGMAFLHFLQIIGSAILPESVEPSGTRVVRAKLKRSSPVASSSRPNPSYVGAHCAADDDGEVTAEFGRSEDLTEFNSRSGAKVTETSRGDGECLEEVAAFVASGNMMQAVRTDESSVSAAVSDIKLIAG